MKTRILSALVGAVILFVIVWSNQMVLGVAIFIVALIAMNEFYNAVANIGYKPVRTVGYLSCFPILFIGLNGIFKSIDSYFELFKSINYFSLGIFLIIVALFSFTVFLHDKYNLNDIALTVFGIIYVTFLFSFIVLTRNLENGFYYIWLVFIGAWATDTFAYFSGLMLGKKKLLPAISPKKTIEGSIGGIIGCVVITVLYGVFINKFVNGIHIYHFVIIGAINGVISQIGDLAASSIKRYVKIKDYGRIMPGHGGVLDRVDSILFVAPVVYFYISFIIIK